MGDLVDQSDLGKPRPGVDPAEIRARRVLRRFFEENREEVFFTRQVQVRHEDEFFHWITARAIRNLLSEGLLLTETRKLTTDAEVHLLWHSGYRYYRRAASRVMNLIEEYAAPNLGGAIGSHGELIVLEGFAQQQFVLQGRNTNRYLGREWSRTGHDLDFIFERDRCVYGVEVKNTLGYIEYSELEAKIGLCKHLGIRPVFVVRMMPKVWINEVRLRGGFTLVLKYQLYPRSHRDLANRVRTEFGLPVDAPRSLNEGTVGRFLKWHRRQL